MNGEEDEKSWFGMEESMSIYTTPCNLNFHYIKLRNLEILLLRKITLFSLMNQRDSYHIWLVGTFGVTLRGRKIILLF